MSRKRQDIWVGLLVGIFLAFGVTGTVLATDLDEHDDGNLPITAPWGAANLVSSSPPTVEVTYEVKASGNITQEAKDAVDAGIQAWIDAINMRENGWQFNLVGVGSSSGGPSGASSPLFSHAGQHGNPPGQGGGGGGGGGDDTGNGKADIQIQLKKGGGAIAGLTRSTIDADGFRVGASIQISGSLLGTGSDPETITEITMHELGHGLSALGHHSNENDLMGQRVGHVDGTSIVPDLPADPAEAISECDLKTFEVAHHWLTMDDGSAPHLNHDMVVNCPPTIP